MTRLLLLNLLPLACLHADPILIAHRGLLQHAPENTIPAFASCLELGMGFELDIRTTKDGKLVVIHDSTLPRTTNGPNRSIHEITWKELRQLDAGSWFDSRFTGIRVPSLEETFALVREHKRRPTLLALTSRGSPGTAKGNCFGFWKNSSYSESPSHSIRVPNAASASRHLIHEYGLVETYGARRSNLV